MAGRMSVVVIAALAAIAVLVKPSDPRMGRFKGSQPERRWRYKCQNCGHVVTRMHRQQAPPPCSKCNGRTKLVTRRRRG